MQKIIHDIQWTIINTQDDNTFPIGLREYIIFNCDSIKNFVIQYDPSLELVVEFKGGFNMVTKKTLYVKHEGEKLKIIKWAILKLDTSKKE